MIKERVVKKRNSNINSLIIKPFKRSKNWLRMLFLQSKYQLHPIHSIQEMKNAIVAAIELASAKRSNRKTPSEKDPRFQFRGTRVPILRSIFKAKKNEFLANNEADRVALIDALMKTNMAEEQLIAISFMGLMPKFFSSSTMKQLDRWLGMLHGWSLIDHLSIELIRSLLEQDEELLFEWIEKWSRSKSYWKRRLSAVAFVRKIAAQRRFHARALELCERLAFDEEDMVQKGVGWCLQDLMRTGEPAVFELLCKLRKEAAPSTVIAYALRKSSPEIKDSVRLIGVAKFPREKH